MTLTWPYTWLCYISQIAGIYASRVFPAEGMSSHSPQRRFQPGDWIIQDLYEGDTFFDHWDFWRWPDPTHGFVNYKSAQDAWAGELIGIDWRKKVTMRVDNRNALNPGQYRDSVRIHSRKHYNQGLFILDVEHVPTGCSSWPAFWFCGPDWPVGGEIDVMESVHRGTKNQMTLHTDNGCYLTDPGLFSGSPIDTDCKSSATQNGGCGIISAQDGTAGPSFNSRGGGVYAMQWDDDGIQIWVFNREAVPEDIYRRRPMPISWRNPDAAFASSGCDTEKYFFKMQIIFDITICGDWAGTAGSGAATGCSEECSSYVLSPQNFDEAYWTINSLVTYRSSLGFPDGLNGTQTGGWGNVTVVPASSASRDIFHPSGFIKRDVRHSLLVCVVVGLLWWRFS